MPSSFEVPAAPAEPSYRAKLISLRALVGNPDDEKVKFAFDTLTQFTFTRLSTGCLALHGYALAPAVYELAVDLAIMECTEVMVRAHDAAKDAE